MGHDNTSCRLQPGQRVRVTEGLFAGKEGRLLSASEIPAEELEDVPPFVPPDAYWVMLSFCCEDTPVCFLPSQLTAIEQPTTQAG